MAEQIAAPTARPGTVVRYRPAPRFPDDRDPRWCREGVAVADKDGRLVDTYWGSSSSDNHVVRGEEIPSIEIMFHLDDYDELDRWHPDVQKWATYAEGDRQFIPSQHGLQRRYFIRKGAVPSRETMLETAREKVAEAERAVDHARRELTFAREDLVALRSAPPDCICRPSMCDRETCPACAGGASWTDCRALPRRLEGSRG